MFLANNIYNNSGKNTMCNNKLKSNSSKCKKMYSSHRVKLNLQNMTNRCQHIAMSEFKFEFVYIYIYT